MNLPNAALRPTRDEKPPLRRTMRVVHRLPGRVRVRLDRTPHDPGEMIEAVSGHAGLDSIDYTPVTQSLLIGFDSGRIVYEEVLLRIAMAYSLDAEAAAVRIVSEVDGDVMSDGAAWSGISLVLAVIARSAGIRSKGATRLERLAAVGTAGAVVDHAWREVRQKGYVDPEVLSLGYLATSAMRGRSLLTAAAVTWITTFGRHLLESPKTGVEIRPVVMPGEGQRPRYELVIEPDVDTSRKAHFFHALQGLVKYAVSGSPVGRGLLDDLREVSKVHGEVLHGLGPARRGIPVRFQ